MDDKPLSLRQGLFYLLVLLLVLFLSVPIPAGASGWESVPQYFGHVTLHLSVDYQTTIHETLYDVHQEGHVFIQVDGVDFTGANYWPRGTVRGTLDTTLTMTIKDGSIVSNFSGKIDRAFGNGQGPDPCLKINRTLGRYAFSLPHVDAEGPATVTIHSSDGNLEDTGQHTCEINPLVPDNYRLGADPVRGDSFDLEASEISGSYNSTGELLHDDYSNLGCRAPVTVTASWHFSFERPQLKADAGGPYTVERGQPVALDGSASTGLIKQYSWTFSPAGDCPEDLSPGASKTGVRSSVVPLCSMTATLTVTDGAEEDSAEVPITVTPRDWHTPLRHVSEEVELEGAEPPLILGGILIRYVGAINTCALDASQGEDFHLFHPPEADGSWEGGGYTLRQVQDPEGPFDTWWYVDDYRVEIMRVTAINPYLLPGDLVPLAGAEPFYEANVKRGADVAGYLQAVRDHEYEHSMLRKEALASLDPAEKVEKRSAAERDRLKQELDKLIREAEKEICIRGADPLAISWSGELWFPENDTGLYQRTATVVVGGEKGMNAPSVCE